MKKYEACQAFYSFFAKSLIYSKHRSINVRFYLSYDIKITKMHFCHEKVNILTHLTQRYNGCHYAALLNLIATSGLSIL